MYTFSTFRFIDVPYYLLKYKRSVFGKIQSNNWVAKELKASLRLHQTGVRHTGFRATLRLRLF